MAAILDQPPEALDKVYAQSLFELAEQQGGRELLDELADEMDQLIEIRAKDPQIMEFWRSKVIPAKGKVEVLRGALGGKINDLLHRTLMYLARKERLDRTWQVFTAYQRMLDERFGKVEIDVYTRFPLEKEQIESLRGRLHQVLKREPVMHAYIDEGMIGGMRLQVGDKLIDASIATGLQRMKERLLEDGANAVRSRIERIIGE